MEQKIQEALDYYNKNKELYRLLCEDAYIILKKVLDEKNINYQSIDYRVKAYDSYKSKCEKPKYVNPIEEIKDIAGVRIIVYLNSDAKKIGSILEELFVIDPKNSENKREELDSNQVGYIADHYVLSYTKERLGLMENLKFEDLCFELQVKTLLQHTWAEISHDRTYKFSGVLPKDIERRFNLTAGILEMVDLQFQNLSDELDKYKQESEKLDYANVGKYDEDIEITSLSLTEYMNENFSFDSIDKKLLVHNKVIAEIKDMGFQNLNQFDSKVEEIYKKLSETIRQKNITTNFTGLIRDILMIIDIERYFSYAWKHNWGVVSPGITDILDAFNIPYEEYFKKYNLMPPQELEWNI